MGDAADDLFDRDLAQEELRFVLLLTCEAPPPRQCDWHRNEDGLLECSTCKRIVDE